MSDPRQSALEAISQVSGRPVAELAPEQELVADLDIDSPKALQLLIEIEDRLGVEISDEAAEELNTVADVIRFVEGTASA